VRGVICANQKSARSRSPASNWACEIIGSPSRSLRRRSQAMGLSAALNVSEGRGLSSRGFELSGGMGALNSRGADWQNLGT
jgi:hypothetical protein